MNKNMRGILSGVIGGVVFILSSVVVGFNFLISALLAVGGYIAGTFIFHEKDEIDVHLSGGVTQAMLDETLAEGYKKLKVLKDYRKKIFNESVGRKIDAIADVIDRIFENFKKDPKDIKAARQFLSYYLDSTLKIVDKYIDLSARGIKSADLVQSLAKVEELLDTIYHAFEKQLEILVKDDVMDLDTELKLLESTIKMEGLGQDYKTQKKQ